MAERIRLSRARGWRKPPGVVVVARPTRWGNPWRVTLCSRTDCTDAVDWPRDRVWCVTDGAALVHSSRHVTRRAAVRVAVDHFAAWLWTQPGLYDAVLERLAGRDLACWCKLDEPCHADVLLQVANQSLAGKV